MITAEDLQIELAHCHCSESHYQHWLGIRYTRRRQNTRRERGMLLAPRRDRKLSTGATHQGAIPTSKNSSFWLLTVNDDHSAVLACYEDSPSTCSPVSTQDIPFTDFVLPEIKLYVEYGVVLLPSEH